MTKDDLLFGYRQALFAEMRARFGENLARCRERAGISQEELSFRASIHRTEVSMLERGERMPRVNTTLRIAGSLGVLLDELVTGLEWRPAYTIVVPGGWEVVERSGQPGGQTRARHRPALPESRSPASPDDGRIAIHNSVSVQGPGPVHKTTSIVPASSPASIRERRRSAPPLPAPSSTRSRAANTSPDWMSSSV